MNYTILGYLVTLVFGAILSYVFLNPLGLLVFLLIWIDALLIARIPMAETLGFEVLTLAAIIGGISLGPVFGFFFALVGIPILATLLILIVYRTAHPYIPNINFLAMAIAAGLAGILEMMLPFLWVVFIAIFFKYFVLEIINLRIGAVNILYAFVNIVFSIGFMLVIKEMGLLVYFV